MSSFDVIEASGQGYKVLIQEARYLVRLAAIPLLIKLACYSFAVLMGWEQNFIRLALVMLPSYFADGWMVSHMVRMIYLDQRWPFQPTGNMESDMARLRLRASGIMKGTLVFVIIKFLLAGVMAALFSMVSLDSENPPETVEPDVLAVIFFVFFLSIWGFRFLWAYIPAAVDYSLEAFARQARGFKTAFRMIGTWLVCFLPLFFFFDVFFSALILATTDGAPEGETIQPNFLLICVQVILDTLMTLLTTAGLSYAVMDLIGWKKPDAP